MKMTKYENLIASLTEQGVDKEVKAGPAFFAFFKNLPSHGTTSVRINVEGVDAGLERIIFGGFTFDLDSSLPDGVYEVKKNGETFVYSEDTDHSA